VEMPICPADKIERLTRTWKPISVPSAKSVK